MRKVRARTCNFPSKANILVPFMRRDAENDPLLKELFECYDYAFLDRFATAYGFGDRDDRSQCRRGVLVSAFKTD